MAKACKSCKKKPKRGGRVGATVNVSAPSFTPENGVAAVVGVIASLFVPQMLQSVIPATGDKKKDYNRGLGLAIGAGVVFGAGGLMVDSELGSSFLLGASAGSVSQAAPYVFKAFSTPFKAGFAGTGMGEAVSDDLLSLDLDSIGAADDNTILRAQQTQQGVRMQ
jgi:hypothetical protein